MAQCHLAGRMPHGQLWDLLLRVGFPHPRPDLSDDEYDSIKREIEAIAAQIGAIVREYRATLLQSGRKAGTAPAGQREILEYLHTTKHLTAEGVDKATQVYRESSKCRLFLGDWISPLLQIPPETDWQAIRRGGKKWGGQLNFNKHGDWASIDAPLAPKAIIAKSKSFPQPAEETPGPDISSIEGQMQALLVSRQYAILRILISTERLDLKEHMCVRGGLHRILRDNLWFYLVCNQILLHGWGDILTKTYPPPLNGPPKATSTSMFHKSQFRWCFHDHVVPSYDFCTYKEIGRYADLQSKHCQAKHVNGFRVYGSAITMEDIHALCKEALFPNLVAGAHLLQFQSLVKQQTPDWSLLEDANEPSADGWNVELCACDCIRECFLSGTRFRWRQGDQWRWE